MIEFKEVYKSFDEETVLRNISFKIARGETKIILGESGSGKSTILKLMLGLIHPDSGQILIEGQDITQMSEQELVGIRHNIGMVFQEGALFDSLSVRENVGYRFFEEGKMSESEIDQAVLQLLGFVGLEDAIDKMPAELSGGMKRRVGIARALLGTPRIILYDEPTAGLDPITKRTIIELMIKLRDMEGVTSVFVTHDLQAASVMAREHVLTGIDGRLHFDSGISASSPKKVSFLMLHDASICFEGSFEELMKSELPYVRAFVS